MLDRLRDNRQLQELRSLMQGDNLGREDLIVFTGRPSVIMPGELVFDRDLSGDDKIYWAALRFICSEVGEIKRVPDQGTLADRLGKSRQSISNYQKMLRATRWISVIDKIVVNNLPTRYSYAIHDLSISIEDACRFDPGYMAFILAEAENKSVERLYRYCRRLLIELDDELLTLLNSEQEAVRQRVIEEKVALAVKNPGSGETSAVKNPGSGETSAVKNPGSGETSAVQNPGSGENSAVKNPGSGETSAVKNPGSGETSAVKNPGSGAESGDVYITAREHAHARMYTRAPGGIIKTFGFNNTYSHPSDGGCGGKVDGKFTFLEKPLFAELLSRLNRKYGKGTMRTLLGLLKRGHYRYDGVDFCHWADEEDVTMMLVSLLGQRVNAPGKYVEALLYRAHCNELTYLGDQHAQLQAIRKELADRALQEQAAAVQIGDGSVLLDEYNRAYYVAGEYLDGETLVRDSQTSNFGRINGGLWHGRSMKEAKLAIVQGKLRVADDATTQRIAATYQRKRAEEDAATEAFYRNLHANTGKST